MKHSEIKVGEQYAVKANPKWGRAAKVEITQTHVDHEYKSFAERDIRGHTITTKALEGRILEGGYWADGYGIHAREGDLTHLMARHVVGTWEEYEEQERKAAEYKAQREAAKADREMRWEKLREQIEKDTGKKVGRYALDRYGEVKIPLTLLEDYVQKMER